MRDAAAVLALYQRLSELAAQMLHAAESGEWDHLIALETQRAACLHSLAQDEQAPALSPAAREAIAASIHAILHSERAVGVLAQLRMAELSVIINSTHTERKLSLAYDTPL